jgi:hypothetical protein
VTRFSRFAIVVGLGLATPAFADFIDTTWTVTGFTGDASFIDPETVIGDTQSFDGGFAEGVFFTCDFAGLTVDYTRYEGTSFFRNPEFVRYLPLRDEMTDASTAIFVHRISCEGRGDPLRRSVLYPFVTNEIRTHAWYLFEGGVFTLRAE